MLIAFIIWIACAAVFLVIGIRTWTAKTAAVFFAGVEATEVSDVKKYNHAVAILWFVYAAIFALLGVPFLYLKQNSPGFLFSILGTVAITLGLVVGYHFILNKYEKHKKY